MEDLDEADQAFIASLVPEGVVVDGFYTIVSWMSPDGERNWRSYNQFDAPLSTLLGFLQMAQFELLCNNTPAISGDDSA